MTSVPPRLYVAMVADRHTDPEPYVFSTPEAAIGFAREWARDGARREEDFQEEPIDGWLYYARYSVEDDSVWVVEKGLDVGEEDGEQT
jgi:hypothetical protein